MARAIEFFFDYGSPYSYLANAVLPELAQRHAAELVYRPMLLGAVFKATGNQSPVQVPVASKRAYGARALRRTARLLRRADRDEPALSDQHARAHARGGRRATRRRVRALPRRDLSRVLGEGRSTSATPRSWPTWCRPRASTPRSSPSAANRGAVEGRAARDHRGSGRARRVRRAVDLLRRRAVLRRRSPPVPRTRARRRTPVKTAIGVGGAASGQEGFRRAVEFVVEAEKLGVDAVWTAEAWGQDAIARLRILGAKTSGSNSAPASCRSARARRR